MDVQSQGEIQAKLRFFSTLAAIGGLLLLMMVAIFMGIVLVLAIRIQAQSERVADAAQQSHAAWCASEENTVANIRQSTLFISKNPGGLLGADGEVLVSVETLTANINRQRQYLDAIRANVLCEGGEPRE